MQISAKIEPGTVKIGVFTWIRALCTTLRSAKCLPIAIVDAATPSQNSICSPRGTLAASSRYPEDLEDRGARALVKQNKADAGRAAIIVSAARRVVECARNRWRRSAARRQHSSVQALARFRGHRALRTHRADVQKALLSSVAQVYVQVQAQIIGRNCRSRGG